MGRADTHVHCNYSGFNNLGILKFPESVIDPQVQVDDARRRGIDVLAITDHNETAGAFIAQKYAEQFDDIEVIVGDEVMTRYEDTADYKNDMLKQIQAAHDEYDRYMAPRRDKFYLQDLIRSEGDIFNQDTYEKKLKFWQDKLTEAKYLVSKATDEWRRRR